MDGKLEHTLFSDLEDPSNFFINKLYANNLKAAINTLDLEEQELVDHVFFKKYSLRKYAKLKNIPYSLAISMRNEILYKLKKELNKPSKSNQRN